MVTFQSNTQHIANHIWMASSVRMYQCPHDVL